VAIQQNQAFSVELVTPDQDTVKLMVTALGKASTRRTRIALDLVYDASEITRRRLIESQLDQDAACIGRKIRKNRPDARKGGVRIVGSRQGRQEQKESGQEVVRSRKP